MVSYSESLIGFALFLVILAVKNVVSLIKNHFHQKRGSILMHAHVKPWQSWPQFGIKVFEKIFVLTKIDICGITTTMVTIS